MESRNSIVELMKKKKNGKGGQIIGECFMFCLNPKYKRRSGK